MSIFDNAHARDNHRYGFDSIRPMEMDLSTKPTGRVADYTTDRNKEWVLELKLAQNFWANDVQRRDIEKCALMSLAAELYQDVLRELPGLRLAIMSGDKGGALEAAGRIEKATQP